MASREESPQEVADPELGVVHREAGVCSADGTPLWIQSWSPGDGKIRMHVLVVHGYAEHGGRYRGLGHALAHRGISITALDLRGHGRSGGPRGYIDRFEAYFDDVDAALSFMRDQGAQTYSLLGHSNGGLITLAYLARRNGAIDSAVVTNPFLALAQKLPIWKRLAANVAGRARPQMSIPSGIEPTDLTHDAAIVEAYARDPLVFRSANASWFRITQQEQARIRQLESVPVPLLYIYSEEDRIACPAANRTLAGRLRAPDKAVWSRAGEFHEVLNETHREELQEQIGEWLLDHAHG